MFLNSRPGAERETKQMQYRALLQMGLRLCGNLVQVLSLALKSVLAELRRYVYVKKIVKIRCVYLQDVAIGACFALLVPAVWGSCLY